MQGKQVTCPGCKGPSLFEPSNHYRPFCSARCQRFDFSAWASESFRVEAANLSDDVDIAQDPPVLN